jgi:phosphoglycerate kinase
MVKEVLTDFLVDRTHIGRPYDKKTKTIRCEAADSVDTVVEYLHRKLKIKFAVPDFVPHGE